MCNKEVVENKNIINVITKTIVKIKMSGQAISDEDYNNLIKLLKIVGENDNDLKQNENKTENNIPLRFYNEINNSDENVIDKKDYNFFRIKAEQGNAEAQNTLGDMYYNGEGIEKDFKEAFKWYSKAANQNYALAQYSLGKMYYNGDGIDIDFCKAHNWFIKSAKLGNNCAICYLGTMYVNGDWVYPDCEKAYQLYQKAAVNGSACGWYGMGWMYYFGIGFEVNWIKAYYYFERAAKSGHRMAMGYLSEMLRKGYGVDRDLSKADEWKQQSGLDDYELWNLRKMEYGLEGTKGIENK